MKPVNLNKYRKAKARADKKVSADANAVKFGRKTSEKQAEKSAQIRQINHIDGHKLDKPPD